MISKIKIIVSTIVIFSLFFVGCTNSKNSDEKTAQNNDNTSSSQEEKNKERSKDNETKKIITFKNDNNLDINDYNEIDRKSVDMDNDGKEEDVILVVKGERLYSEEGYVFILKKDTKKVLTYFDAGGLAINLTEIRDVNNDGVKDFIIKMSGGGTAGSCDITFFYDSGEYKPETEYSPNSTTSSTTTKGSNPNTICESLYSKIGMSKSEVEYLYSPTDNYVDESIANNYYIYSVLLKLDSENLACTDYNVIVNKKSGKIYNYYPDGSMEQIK